MIDIKRLNNLELIDLFVEKCVDGCPMHMTNELYTRGLFKYIKSLPKDIPTRRKVVYLRMNKDSEYIHNRMSNYNKLKAKLARLEPTEVHRIRPLLIEMQQLINELTWLRN